jgi:hypothetical protein
VFIWEICQGELWRGERTSGGSEQTVKGAVSCGRDGGVIG